MQQIASIIADTLGETPGAHHGGTGQVSDGADGCGEDIGQVFAKGFAVLRFHVGALGAAVGASRASGHNGVGGNLIVLGVVMHDSWKTVSRRHDGLWFSCNVSMDLRDEDRECRVSGKQKIWFDLCHGVTHSRKMPALL